MAANPKVPSSVSGENLLIQHYSSARSEIAARLQSRQQTLAFYLTGIAALMGFALQQPALWPLFYFVPFLGLYAEVSYVQDDLSIRVISIWLKTEYTTAMDAFRTIHGISHALPHWDGALHEGSKSRVIASRLRYYANHLIFGLAGLAGIGLASASALTHMGWRMTIFFGGICLVPLGITFYVIIHADRHRRKTGVFQPSPKAKQ